MRPTVVQCDTAPSNPPAANPTRGLDDYALACQRVGQPVIRCAGSWWREVRPCFFRPLLPYLDQPAGPAHLPFRAIFGGCQYPAQADSEPPNSVFEYIAFPRAQEYSIKQLRHSHRSEVRSAEKRFIIGRIRDEEEFKARAHSVYLEFRARTRYEYLDGRIRKPVFDGWVEAEFGDPGLIALGAWRAGDLLAVTLSRIVGHAWVYSSFFASDEALRGHVAGLMLHHVRSLAAAEPGVTMVFGGAKKAAAVGASVDAFYLHRGAALATQATVLQVNPLAKWALMRFSPEVWARLSGIATAERRAERRLGKTGGHARTPD